MAPGLDEKDEFVHQIAIKLSRTLNLINPNDLLAERVIDIAKTSAVEGFTTGSCLAISLPGIALTHRTSCEIFWQVQGFFLVGITYRNSIARKAVGKWRSSAPH
jgi:hypothetical protein